EKDEIINIVQKYFNSYRKLLKQLNESGADVSKIRNLFGKSRAKLKENDYLGAVELYSEINIEMKNYENNLIGYEIDSMTNEVESVSDKYPTASAIGALSKARKELDKDNIEGAKSLISESQKLLSDMEEHYLKAQEIIDNVEQKIKSFQNSGLNISNAMEILSEMQEAFSANKYLELPNLKKKCLLEIEKSRTKYSEVLVKIGVTQKKLSEKHKQGVNIFASVNAIKEAKKFLIAGDYDQAIELTNKSLDLVDEQHVAEESSELATASEEKEGETPETMNDIAWGDSYLLRDTTAVVAFTIQRLLSEQNVSSLTVSYLSAQELSDKHTFKPDIAIWLNESDDKNAVMPSDLSKLTKKITKFVKGTEMSIILIDGLEIIIQYNDIDQVKDFLEGLKKAIDKKQSIMILIMNPNEISEEEAEALKDICKDLVNVDMKSIFKLL
ncbi:MAG: DUF835 domain-containing protein, partial [Thermoplasmata archaeon]|nr:DUF835 domain-containing protein [Thermoplasmata archaeon]